VKQWKVFGMRYTLRLSRGRVPQLFRELDDVAKEATHQSVFLRGMRYLQTLQVPLERFKEALDLASPLANLERTSATVLEVV
jgi:hypothetical protein